MSHWTRFSTLIFAMLALAFSASAQTDRASLEGTVSDSSGATIGGATVRILQVETNQELERRTNSDGLYRFPAIALGRYTVTVSNPGFKTRVTARVNLEVGQTYTLDVRLDVGAATDRIEVIAEAGPAERSSAEKSIVLGQTEIANLPVNGRDWSGLTMLAPFAQDDGGGNQRTIRYAGRAIDDNNFNFDGVDAGGIQEQAQKSQVRLQISEDAVAEYRVNSALYDAEYGTQAGAQVNVITKSGTNDLHGTVFGYLRNSIFDARNFNDFDNSGAVPVPIRLPFRLGQYGMTLGGSIVKEKLFFFVNYEGLRQLQSNTQTAKVPGPGLQQAILAQSPQMCSILQAYPWRKSTGTIAGCAPVLAYSDAAFVDTPDPAYLPMSLDTFTHAAATTIHEDTALMRIDYKLNDRTVLYGRAQRDILHSDQPAGNLFDKQLIYNHPANYFIALQYTFSPNVFNEAKVYVNRSPYHNPYATALPYAVVSGRFEMLNNRSADIEVGTTYGFIDNLTWTRGRHTFKSGMELRRIRLNQGQTANNTITFGDDPTMIAAQPAKLNFIAPWCCHKYRRGFVMPYFQDEWKVTPTFTANLGVRYDYYGVEHVPDNRTTVFDLNQFHGACLGSGSFNTPFPAPINTPPCPKNPVLYNPNYRNVDPRVSFAWAPAALHAKTVVRSGFGIYSGAAQNDDLNAGLESDTFRASVNGPTLGPAIQQEIPDLSGVARAANHPRALQREGRRDQYVETWGLTIEQQLPANLQFSTTYLGTHGVHLFSRGAVNLCTPPAVLNSAANDCVRPLDQYFTDPNNPDPYGSVDYKSDTGQSRYNALLVALQRPPVNGLSFVFHYTFAHSINDGATGGGEANGQENVNCRACDKGNSATDIRHSFIGESVYELPFGPGKRWLTSEGVVGKIAGGWKVSGLGTFHTGHPLTVTLDLSGPVPTPGTAFYTVTGDFPSTYLLPDGNDQTTQRPDLVPGVPLFLPGGGHNGIPLINIAAFQAPPVDSQGRFTRFGNAGNGILRALNIWQADVVLEKETRITERLSVEFGVQAFNIFNHVQLGDPGVLSLTYAPGSAPVAGGPVTNLSDPGNFGVISNTVNGLGTNTGTGLPRQLQFMLRVKF